MLMRFDPFRELDRVTQLLSQPGGTTRQMTMPMDAYRDGDRFIVQFDLPGVDPSSIDLTVEKNVLTVRAERSWPRKEGQDVVVTERPQGTFSRQLFLGESLDTEHVDASYEQGVLTLTIPVAEQAKPRKVEVMTGESQGRSIPAGATAGSSG
jgi:HSP20 family protein